MLMFNSEDYNECLTKEYAKRKLKSVAVFDGILSCSLSSVGQLHDLMIQHESMTPDEYKQHGKRLVITYGSCPSPFGRCFIATTPRGICQLAFFDHDSEQNILQESLYREWASAHIERDDLQIQQFEKSLFSINDDAKNPLRVLLRGSSFQLKVWEALLSVPSGELVSYQHIASFIGKPRAVRAVASAIARNNIAYLIPCHRVIRQTADFGQYRWGSARKRALVAWEAFRQSR